MKKDKLKANSGIIITSKNCERIFKDAIKNLEKIKSKNFGVGKCIKCGNDAYIFTNIGQVCDKCFMDTKGIKNNSLTALGK